ncbi:MAG TPA: hypothetical protein VJ779_13000, partial [Acetobacteraceae bacterium]|nr:hypothetical protein [Acetobacteraceae bacterium]
MAHQSIIASKGMADDTRLPFKALKATGNAGLLRAARDAASTALRSSRQITSDTTWQPRIAAVLPLAGSATA